MKIIIYFFVIIISFKSIPAQWATSPDSTFWFDDIGSNGYLGSGGRINFMTPDSNGGVYLSYSWTYWDSVQKSRTFIEHLDKYGYRTWTPGLAIGVSDIFFRSKAISDPEGNLIVAYSERKYLNFIPNTGYIYDRKIRLEKINVNGERLWDDPKLVTVDSMRHTDFDICGDGLGGAYIMWKGVNQYSGPDSTYISLQHFDFDGNKQMGANGFDLYRGEEQNIDENLVRIFSDNENGVIGIKPIVYMEFSYFRMDINHNILWEIPNRAKPFKKESFFDNSYLLSITQQTEQDYYLDIINKNGNYYFNSPVLLSDSISRFSNIDFAEVNSDSTVSVFYNYLIRSPLFSYPYFQKIRKNGTHIFPGRGLLIYPNNEPLDWGASLFTLSTKFEYIVNAYNSQSFWSKRIDKNGETLLNDIEITKIDAYLPRFTTDSNDGFIASFLSDEDYLYIQQVSKNGELGEIITKVDDDEFLKKDYYLAQNYPNPFNPTTTIQYKVSDSGIVSLKIYDVLGKEVKILVNQKQEKGRHEVIFDASDLASGVYIYRIVANDFFASKKLLLLK